MAKEPITPGRLFSDLLNDNKPQAMAWVTGGPAAPYLSGLVKFYETPYGGVLTEAEVFGLPDQAEPGSSNLYGMHILKDGSCSGAKHCCAGGMASSRRFQALPPLLSGQGYGWASFYDKRFTIPDILGRSVIISQNSDGSAAPLPGENSGRIGCGIIRLVTPEEKAAFVTD